MSDAFFLPDGDVFVPTDHTVGPWDPGAQHAGPPAALLGRTLEGHEGRPHMRVSRITLEILRPIPITPLKVESRMVRPGKRVEFLHASLSDSNTEVMRASAWRIRADRSAVDLPPEAEAPPPGPEHASPGPPIAVPHRCGYCEAMEWRYVEGGFQEPGPATAWMRMRHPLVPGEEPSPLTRVLIAADSGNGISGVLDPTRFLFVNTELTVHLFRYPEGEWVCLRSQTLIGPEGIGLAETALYDETGRIGRGGQSLLVTPRWVGGPAENSGAGCHR